MRIKLEIEYDGTMFCGWQRQENATSVQETIENAIASLFNQNERIEVYGAGRTDTGVHAMRQVAHFDIKSERLEDRWRHNCHKLPRAINSYMLGRGVVITKAEEASNDFHARFSAKMRTYRYLIYNRPVESVLHKNRAWNVSQILDVEKMNTAAMDLLGLHDFDAFRSSECGAKNAIRSISDIKVYKNEDFVVMDISAKSFLHNQVRITMGTLKEIGCGKLPESYIRILLDSRDRTKAGITAPPQGLYLMSVNY